MPFLRLPVGARTRTTADRSDRVPARGTTVALIVLGGLPGTGKSTLANALAARLGGTHLRIDTIEQAMRNAGQTIEGPEGYLVARDVARENLRPGLPVIVDAVNPIAYTRELWRNVAAETAARFAEIEVVCSDAAEHRRRVETRSVEIDGLKLPTWQDVLDREYEPWGTATTLDTASSTVDQCVAAIVARLARK